MLSMLGARFPDKPLILLLCGHAILFGQQEPPAFRVGTTLVEFTIVALDDKGQPVGDLRRDEIRITEQGRPREVAFFQFEGSESPPVAPPQLPPGVFTNRFEPAESKPRNITAIVIDTLNTPPGQQAWVLTQVLRYLRDLAPGTRIALYQIGKNVRVLHDFTEDASSLREQLAKVVPTQDSQKNFDINSMADDAERLLADLPPAIRAQLQEILAQQMETAMDFNAMSSENRANRTLASLEAIGNRLAGIPGRKSVVWISGGISMLSIGGRGGGVNSFEQRVVRSARRLATQGVTMYIVDAAGLQNAATLSAQSATPPPGQGTPDSFARVREMASMAAETSATMYRIAAITGGRVSRNSNDMAMGMKAAAADQQGSYSVGFYAQSPTDDTWHSLAVKAKRPGVRLVYRQGYLAESAAKQASDWTEQQWQAAILNPLGSTAIRLDAKAAPIAGGATGDYQGELEIEGGDLHFRPVDGRLAADIDVVVVGKTRAGLGEFQMRSARIGPPPAKEGPAAEARLPYTIGFRVAPDTSSVRVVVRDRLTGRFGTIDFDIKHLPAK
jgi:VWFA-related protein